MPTNVWKSAFDGVKLAFLSLIVSAGQGGFQPSHNQSSSSIPSTQMLDAADKSDPSAHFQPSQQTNGTTFHPQGPSNGPPQHRPPYTVPPPPANGFVPSQPARGAGYHNGGQPVSNDTLLMSGALPSNIPVHNSEPMAPPLLSEAASAVSNGKM